jgi:hypothetical protein
MDLGPPGLYTTPQLSATKEAMEAFLGDAALLAQATAYAAGGKADAAQLVVLGCFAKTFGCYQMADPQAVGLRASCTAIEDALNDARNKTFALGFADPAKGPAGGAFEAMSSVQVRAAMRNAPDEATRKAAWGALRSIGPFVLGAGLCDMVKLRNAMARKLGFADFYDYKVTQAEGFGKDTLFGILDTLKLGSDALLAKARAALATEKGASALEPWNTGEETQAHIYDSKHCLVGAWPHPPLRRCLPVKGFLMAGDVEAALDPYFPFEKSLECWGRCFAKLGVDYQVSVGW